MLFSLEFAFSFYASLSSSSYSSSVFLSLLSSPLPPLCFTPHLKIAHVYASVLLGGGEVLKYDEDINTGNENIQAKKQTIKMSIQALELQKTKKRRNKLISTGNPVLAPCSSSNKSQSPKISNSSFEKPTNFKRLFTQNKKNYRTLF